MNLQNFSCPLCLNDFLNISDSLNNKKFIKNDEVLYLIKRDFRDKELQKRIVKRWKKNNRIKFQVLIVKSFLNEKIINYSGILVLNADSFDYYRLPFGKSIDLISTKLEI